MPWPADRPSLVLVLADDAPARVTLHPPAGDHAAPLVELGLLAEGRVKNSVGPQHQLNAASARMHVVDVAVGEAELRVVQHDPASGVEVTSTLRSPVSDVVRAEHALADRLPDDAFLRLGGRRVRENGRFHLDYRSRLVRERMTGVVERLVERLGVGYLKLDYNIVVTGGDTGSGGPGNGLLEHQRTYLDWLDAVVDRHPDLVLENCASGAMRCDHAMLSRLALQSTSDQRDPLLTAPIAVAAPAAVAPEQAAVWAYPQPGMDDERASFCLVNAMLGRVHLSGRLDRMDERERRRVRDALACYRSYRKLIPAARPGWPLGLPGWYDDISALSLRTGDVMLLAVWFRGDTRRPVVNLPLDPQWTDARVEVLYPVDLDTDLDRRADCLTVSVPAAPAARLLRLEASSTTQSSR